MKNTDKPKDQLAIELETSRNDYKKLKDELTATNNRLKNVEKELLIKTSLFEVSATANSIADEKGNLTTINPSFLKIWGFNLPNEVIGKPIPYFFKNEKEALDLLNSLKKEGKWEGEFLAQKKDGSTFIAYGYASAIQNKNNETIYYQSTVIDISKRKKADIELNIAYQKLSANVKQLEKLYQQRTKSEKEQKEAKEFSERIFETSSALIVGLDKDHIIRIFNKGAEKITGYKKAEVMGKDWFKIFFPDDILDEMNSVWKNSWGGLSHSYVNPIIDNKGQEKIISWQITGMYEGKDITKHLSISIGEDITERKKAENKLKISEQHFRALTENASDVISILDEKGNITYESPSHKKVLGYETGTLIGKNVFQLVHPDDQEQISKQFETLLQKPGGIERVTFRFKHNDGFWLHIEGTGKNLLNAPEVAGIVINYRDISERMKTDKRIKKLVRLENTKNLELAESFRQLQISQDASLNMLDDLNKEIKERNKAEIELETSRLNLEQIVQSRTQDLKNSHASLALLLEDVNESREELWQSNKNLELANSDLQAFAYSISHDLRAPLRHIDGFARMLINSVENKNEKTDRYYAKISESLASMANMIEALLSFSRLGRKQLQKTEVDLNITVKKVIKQFKPDIKNRDIKWKVEKLPTISGDNNLIQLVFENLISNAIKFTSTKEKATIEIGSCKSRKKKSDFYIKDNGAGFDMAYVDKLFEVFQRLHTKEEFEGTGIGLANVKQIIRKHGGSVWAKGKIGKGAVFYVSLSGYSNK